MVALFARARIETITQTSMQFRSSMSLSSRGRGSKRSLLHQPCARHRSRSLREGADRNIFSAEIARWKRSRSLREGADRNLQTNDRGCSKMYVALFARARIETSRIGGRRFRPFVALFARARIETHRCPRSLPMSRVALFARARIETFSARAALASRRVALFARARIETVRWPSWRITSPVALFARARIETSASETMLAHRDASLSSRGRGSKLREAEDMRAAVGRRSLREGADRN